MMKRVVRDENGKAGGSQIPKGFSGPARISHLILKSRQHQWRAFSRGDVQRECLLIFNSLVAV